MSIEIQWVPPVSLHHDPSENLIYHCDLDAIPDGPGVYVFGRSHGDGFHPIYIGESLTVRTRVAHHLESVPLMMALKRAKTGARSIHLGALIGKKGLKPKPTLQRIERALIKYALAQGHELVNDKGTKTPYYQVTFQGNLVSRNVFGTSMFIEK